MTMAMIKITEHITESWPWLPIKEHTLHSMVLAEKLEQMGLQIQ
uniref:Uncharacterized protein n=1 Tax=Arundo donax TaxID=35708 RepID=A0A0A9ACE5_ARUDO